MLTDQAAALAQQLVDAGVRATHDPTKAQTTRPCVLIAPPSYDYTQRLATWRVVCLASTDAPNLRAFEDLAALVDQVEAVLPVEQADPVQYPLASGSTVPAYVLRVTTT